MSDYDDDEDDVYDFDDPSDSDEVELPAELQQAVDRLRETLTYDMASRAFRCRMGEDPSDDEDLEMFMDDLIAEAANAGYDEWEEEFLFYD